MFKALFISTGWLAITTLMACSSLPKPVTAIYLSNSKVDYTVESAVHADSVKVKDLRGNTICYKKNVDLVPPLTSVNFGFCTVKIAQLYSIETLIGKTTVKETRCAEE